MKIYKYNNHEDYVKAQEEGVHRHPHPDVHDSINYEWVQRQDVEFIRDNVIAPYFNELGIVPKYGICHGAKLGKENRWFEEATGMDFIGTDLIVETNEKMKLIQWDFHEIKEEWKNKFDVIYSNALDHSYSPPLALDRWTSSLSPNGICILEWSENSSEENSNHIDPFGASLQEYKLMIQASKGEIVSELAFKSVVDVPPYRRFQDKVFITFKTERK